MGGGFQVGGSPPLLGGASPLQLGGGFQVGGAQRGGRQGMKVRVGEFLCLSIFLYAYWSSSSCFLLFCQPHTFAKIHGSCFVCMHSGVQAPAFYVSTFPIQNTISNSAVKVKKRAMGIMHRPALQFGQICRSRNVPWAYCTDQPALVSEHN